MSFSFTKKQLALRLVIFLFLVFLSIVQVWYASISQLSFIGKTEQARIGLGSDFEAMTRLARQKHIFDADIAGARQLLSSALKTNPVFIPAWIALAELYNDKGDREKTDAVYDYVDELTSGIKRWRWEKALAAYQIGKADMLPAELEYIIREIPGKNRADALKLAYTLWETPEELLENVGGENVFHLFRHAISTKAADKALYFWNLIEEDEELWTEGHLLSLFDMLLATDRVADARPIWEKYYAHGEILYNGDFSLPFLRRAFGWRLNKGKGFEVQIKQDPDSEKGNVVYFRFKGWENLNLYNLTQIVPVQGGNVYELAAEMKSEKLTTDQRPQFEVYGHKCKGPVVRSTMPDPDQEWLVHKFSMMVPEQCTAIVVRLRRYPSRHIDNKIRGKLWIRNLEIREVGRVVPFI